MFLNISSPADLMLERRIICPTVPKTEDQRGEGICRRSQSSWVFAVFKQIREDGKMSQADGGKPDQDEQPPTASQNKSNSEAQPSVA